MSLRDDQLKWQAHINCITNAVTKNVYLMSRVRPISSHKECRTVFYAHIVFRMNYVFNVWDGSNDVHMKTLKSVHRCTVGTIGTTFQMLPGRWHTLVDPLPLKQHLQYKQYILKHKVVHNKSLPYLG